MTWLRPDGVEFEHDDWNQPDAHVLGMLIPGEATDEAGDRGRPVVGRTILLLLNGGSRSRFFALPGHGRARQLGRGPQHRPPRHEAGAHPGRQPRRALADPARLHDRRSAAADLVTQAGHFGDPPLDNRRVRATYRLQLRSGVGFREATAAVPYLERLGVSHLYASPLLEARAGSTHGYDVIDPTRLDPALGTQADFDALCAALRDAGLGLVLDIVPNHMAASLESPWWRDLLTHGRDSAFAAVFDVDWEAPGLDGRLLVPVLDIPLEQALAAGDVTVDPPVVRLANGLELPMRPGTHRLDEQAYLLAHWRDANARVDYRRFFDIPDLVGVRVDDPSVFELTHAPRPRPRPRRLRPGPARRPRRRPARPARLPPPPPRRRRPRRPHLGREDPRPRRAAPAVLARRGHDGLRAGRGGRSTR